MRTQKAKNTLLVIKNSDEYGFQSAKRRATHLNPTLTAFTAANPTRMPPLATLHDDSLPTHESDVAQVNGAGYLRSQAVCGAFSPIIGVTSFSSSFDGDSQEMNDISLPKFAIRGKDSYSGSLDLWARKADNRWYGAVSQGSFISEAPRYRESMDFHWYEIWCFDNPDVRRIDQVTKCDMLKKYMYVTFGKNDEEFSNPKKWSLGCSFVAREDIPMWTVPAQYELANSNPTVAAVTGNTDTAGSNHNHTRLAMKLSATTLAITVAVVVRIDGFDYAGFPVYEEIELLTADVVGAAACEFYTHTHFFGPFSITLNDTSKVTGTTIKLQVKDWDYKAHYNLKPQII